MDKNTIWAIILSAIVIIGYAFLDTLVIGPKQRQIREQQQVELQAEEAEKQRQAQEQNALVSSMKDAEKADDQSESDEMPEIAEYTIETSKAKIILTNRGGDIVSYQLLEHLDKDTGSGVEMVDNVTSSNRAFSLAFGDANAPVTNDIFHVRRLDDYTIGFYKDFYKKDEFGNQHLFRLGKLYSFKPDDYAFKFSITINSDETLDDVLNVGGSSYTLRTPPQIGPHYDRKNDRYEVRQFLSLSGNKRFSKAFVDNKYYTREYDWAGVAGKYFTVLVKPVAPDTMSPQIKTSALPVNGYENSQIMLTRTAISAGNVTDDYYVYIGPRSETELIKYNSSTKNAWGLVNAKFNQALQSSGFLSFIEIALKWALEMIFKVVHNWGVAIIILTIILKIILFPLNKTSAIGTLKMQELQPQMKAIQEKYKDNPPKMQEETGKLYRKAGYNPMAGCLPMVLQMMVLWAMFRVFNNYFEFRGASFIKGWIDDLSVGDSIYTFKNTIPILNWNTLRLLPIIYVASQLLNGMITQYGNFGGNAQTQTQMKFMMYGMPLIFFFMFYNVPSGLLLYWTVSNILQIGQQMIINGVMKKKRAEMEQRASKKNNVVQFKGGKKKSR